MKVTELSIWKDSFTRTNTENVYFMAVGLTAKVDVNGRERKQSINCGTFFFHSQEMETEKIQADGDWLADVALGLDLDNYLADPKTAEVLTKERCRNTSIENPWNDGEAVA